MQLQPDRLIAQRPDQEKVSVVISQEQSRQGVVVFEGLYEGLQQPHSQFDSISHGIRIENQQVQCVPYGLVGIEQIMLHILFDIAEQLFTAVENDVGGL